MKTPFFLNQTVILCKDAFPSDIIFSYNEFIALTLENADICHSVKQQQPTIHQL